MASDSIKKNNYTTTSPFIKYLSTEFMPHGFGAVYSGIQMITIHKFGLRFF